MTKTYSNVVWEPMTSQSIALLADLARYELPEIDAQLSLIRFSSPWLVESERVQRVVETLFERRKELKAVIDLLFDIRRMDKPEVAA